MCQGFSHFLGFLYHFVLAKLATSRIRVKSRVHCAYLPKRVTYPHVLAAGHRVLVMRVDVEGHQGEGVEGRRVHNGHVVCGADTRRGHVSACTGAYIRHSILNEKKLTSVFTCKIYLYTALHPK